MPASAPPARKPRSDRAERPTPRPSGIRLPLFLAPLPVAGEVPPKDAPRPFEHFERVETHDSITHRWRAPDGRVITATGPNRPIACASPAWFWEGRMVLRRVAGVAQVRRGCPTFTVTESAS